MTRVFNNYQYVMNKAKSVNVVKIMSYTKPFLYLLVLMNN